MILVIDNYDSFTYNLVHLIAETGRRQIQVIRNDHDTVAGVWALQPQAIILSPGPCTPMKSGICLELVRYVKNKVPIFGVCLGMQTICEAFGGETVQARTLMHGKTSNINHNSEGVFRRLPNPIKAVRYHSLATDREQLPAELVITATTEDQEIMAVRHKTLPIEGVQFHPEAYLTQSGSQLIRQFFEDHRL